MFFFYKFGLNIFTQEISSGLLLWDVNCEYLWLFMKSFPKSLFNTKDFNTVIDSDLFIYLQSIYIHISDILTINLFIYISVYLQWATAKMAATYSYVQPPPYYFLLFFFTQFILYELQYNVQSSGGLMSVCML